MEAAQLLALCRVKGADWHFIAREAQRPGGPESLLTRRRSEQSPESEETLQLLEEAEADMPRHQEWAADQIRAATADGIRLTTVLDEDYPMNLRTIFNLPPFLFYRGELRPDDAWSVAVVGTRNASDAGIARARKLSDALAEQGVTVLSGLARGIDTAAHEATLKAGGRTVAVMGTGIRKVYPAGNTELAERIAENGALVSQFWPDAPPTSYNFPRRNVVTSGLGQGTVVIEATATSGAKMQARLALQHGRKVFLLSSLVQEREWAEKYLERPRCYEVESVEDIISMLDTREAIASRLEARHQLTLTLS